MSAPLTVTGTRLAAGVPAPTTGPALPLASPTGRPPGQAGTAARGRHPWRGRWRPLTAAAILAGLVGAGVTAGVAMTAGSPLARAAQSVRQDSGSAPVQTYSPAFAPIARVVISRDHRADIHVHVRDHARLQACAEHAAARDQDPAAGHECAAEAEHVPEPEYVVAVQHAPGASPDHLRTHHPGGLLGRPAGRGMRSVTPTLDPATTHRLSFAPTYSADRSSSPVSTACALCRRSAQARSHRYA